MSISTIGKITDTITVTVHPHDIRNVQITNADRIRSMADEELAGLLFAAEIFGWSKGMGHDEPPHKHREEWFTWLKQECES